VNAPVPVPPPWSRALASLLGAGAVAQAVPLLLGPWLARLYTPAEWGVYALVWAVASNVAVVAWARYDMALPLARSDAEAQGLLALCVRIGAGVMLAMLVVLAVLQLMAPAAIADTSISKTWAAGGMGWWLLPPVVLALAGVQLATMVASRDQRFADISAAKVVQHAGGALAQGVAGAAGAGGVVGLIGGGLAATVAAVWAAQRGVAPGLALGCALQPAPEACTLARRYRDFPLLNTPHAFLGVLQDTLALALIAATVGPAAAGAFR
jgi:O-antigen/teichoic acid export membrane protein